MSVRRRGVGDRLLLSGAGVLIRGAAGAAVASVAETYRRRIMVLKTYMFSYFILAPSLQAGVVAPVSIRDSTTGRAVCIPQEPVPRPAPGHQPWSGLTSS